MAAHLRPSANLLVAQLPHAQLDAWGESMEPVDMPLGSVLHESGTALTNVYFPVDAIVSLLYVTKEGESAEIAVVGHEGMVGVFALLGSGTSPGRAVVQRAGQGLRLPMELLSAACEALPTVRHLLLRYAQALYAQAAQTAVCNRHHTLDQQLCRWLLLSFDRLQGQELVMTQELIANMLGVRREGVTEAAGCLQRNGLIRYHRGHITMLDRPGLERRTCECYGVVKREYDRLLGSDALH